MKSFMTKFASVPTVLVLLLPVGVVAIALGHVLPPTVAKQAETRGQPPSAIQDPRLTQSQILPQHVSPLQPRPTRPNAREPQRLLPDDLLATTPEPPAPAVEIPKYGIGPRAVPSHHHRHPSALRPPPSHPSDASRLSRPRCATPGTTTHTNTGEPRRRTSHGDDPQRHPNHSTSLDLLLPYPLAPSYRVTLVAKPLNPPATAAPVRLPSLHKPPATPTARATPSAPPLLTIPHLHQGPRSAPLPVPAADRPLFLPRLPQPPPSPATVTSTQSGAQRSSPTTGDMSVAPDNPRQVHTAEALPETTFLSTREQASLILIAIFVGYLLANASLRAHLPGLLRTSLSPAILLPILFLFAYTSFEVWIGFQLRWWSTSLAKETVVWTVASGAVLLYKGILEANDEPRFFRKTASATIAPTVFLTFFMNLTTFGLLAELALQLFLIPVTMLSTFAQVSADPKHYAARKICDGLLSLVVLSWFVYTAIHVQSIWHQLDVHLIAQKLILPMWLTLGLLPFIYVLSVYVAYQRPLGIVKSQTSTFRVRWRAIVAIVLTLGLTRLQHFWIKKLVDAKTLAAARSAVRQFERSLRDAERATAEEKDRLRRYAGVDGVDSEGRRLDRREFNETIAALQWLATCHAGHYRKRNRYDRDLLHLLGDSFTTRGIPKETGIVMVFGYRVRD